MPKVTKKGSESNIKSSKPISPEERERQMIALAEDVAEQKLRDGTASSQLITHYLKLGTSRNQLELEKLRNENELLIAKKDSLEATRKSGELLEKAIEAFCTYAGENSEEDDFDV